MQENRITDEDEARIKYSNQRFIYLDIGETCRFRPVGGTEKQILLKSVEDHVDSVIGLVRKADVLLEIDGKPLELTCEPYVMPTETDGLRILADTTDRWLEMPKRVQFSIWDAADPIVDTSLFQFPLPGYRMFALATQCYNEPVHLGLRDGDPEGQRFHHNYGFDMAGFEGRDEVHGCAGGMVIDVQPGQGAVVLEDDGGILFEYGHLDEIHPEVRKGAFIEGGKRIGILGRKGPSGNFSHLHVGVYLSRAHYESHRMNRNLNLYPWMVTAHRMASSAKLYAVARPHLAVRTGETVRFDGEKSMAFGSRITSYRWEFHDGTIVKDAMAEKIYDKPGQYMATLRIEDERGLVDVDFCKVKVFTRDAPERGIPSLFMTFTPTEGIRVDQPLTFRGWPQGEETGPIRIDFNDGTILAEYIPYSEVIHRFVKPGIHMVTATATVDGLPVTQNTKVIVNE